MTTAPASNGGCCVFILAKEPIIMLLLTVPTINGILPLTVPRLPVSDLHKYSS